MGNFSGNSNRTQTITASKAPITNTNKGVRQLHIRKIVTFSKCIASHTDQTILNSYRGQLIAIIETIVTQAYHTIRYNNRSYTIAVIKCTGTDRSNTTRNRNTLQCSTATKCIVFNSDNRIRNRNSGQIRTTLKCIVLDGCYAIGNSIAAGVTSGAEYKFRLILIVQNTGCITAVICITLIYPDTGHRSTGRESTSGNRSHTGRNLDRSQFQTTIERRIIDRLQGRGQADRRQIKALIKCGAGNAGHAFPDDHFGNLGIIGFPGNLIAHGTGTADSQLTGAVQGPGQVAVRCHHHRHLFDYLLKHYGFVHGKRSSRNILQHHNERKHEA